MINLYSCSFGTIFLNCYLFVRVLKAATAPSALLSCLVMALWMGRTYRMDRHGLIIPGGNMASWLVAIKSHQSSAV